MSTPNRKAPYVPQAHTTQRYFHDDSCGMPVSVKRLPSTQDVRVYRRATDAYAQLSIRHGYNGELSTLLNPAELRDLASALLDAAHDIDVNCCAP